jgi:Tol biopolymer transport system component
MSLLLLAAGLPACNNNSRDDTNPFAGAARTVPPPKGAALLFASGVWSTSAGAPRELYSVKLDGSEVTQLTFCNDVVNGVQCDTVEASSAPDALRVAARRAAVDTNGDGQVTEADGTALAFVDLKRGVEALLVPSARRVSGVDWAPNGDIIAYSSLPAGGGTEDLFRIDFNGQNDTNLTCPDPTTACNGSLRERRPRIDPLETIAVFERIDTSIGQAQVALFQTSASIPILTSGPNDADPAFSPDGRRVVFRRLTNATANGGLGSWDILTVAIDGTGLSTVASGPAFRGAPDWGTDGIAWAESDGSGTRLVVSGPDGSAARAIVSQGTTAQLSNPRWLPPQ